MLPDAGGSTIELATDVWRVIVRPAIGGSISRFGHCDGTPVFLPIADLVHGAVDAGGCFPMLPFVNRVRNRRFVLGGREHVLDANLPGGRTVHGFGWQATWTVISSNRDSLHLVHEHSGRGWPSRYRAEQHISIEPDGLRIALQVTNTGDGPMPCGIGLHPYFPLPPEATLRVAAATATGVGGDGFPVPLASQSAVLQTLAGEGAPPADLYLSGVRGPVTLGSSGGRAVVIRASQVFDEFVTYTPPSRDFVCIEPATHRVGALDGIESGVPGNVAVLLPGGTLSGSVFFAPSGYA